MDMTEFEEKMDRIESILTELQQIDYRGKNIKNESGYVMDLDNNPLSIGYSLNSKLFDGKSYDEFIIEMKEFFNDYMDTLSKDIKAINEKRPLDTYYTKEWTALEITGDFWYGAIDIVSFVPEYFTVSIKLESCDEKNGGTDGIIVDIPSIGPSIDGLPIDFNNPDSVKNYSGCWYENGKFMIYLKKGPQNPWVGSCGKLSYKIKAWI
jgi:hypothetical protein